MKPIRVCGVIKDGNRRAAYMLAQNDGCSSSNLWNHEWKVVDATTFENMVKKNQVQDFIWKNNNVKCKLTYDGCQDKELEKAEKDFWDATAIPFKYRHVTMAHKGECLACSLYELTMIMDEPIFAIYTYGDVRYIMQMIQEMTQTLGIPWNNSMFKHNGKDIGKLYMSLPILDDMIKLPSGISKKFLFDTSMQTFILKGGTSRYIKQSITTNNRIMMAKKIINKLNKVTIENEKFLGIK